MLLAILWLGQNAEKTVLGQPIGDQTTILVRVATGLVWPVRVLLQQSASPVDQALLFPPVPAKPPLQLQATSQFKTAKPKKRTNAKFAIRAISYRRTTLPVTSFVTRSVKNAVSQDSMTVWLVSLATLWQPRTKAQPAKLPSRLLKSSPRHTPPARPKS